MDARKIEEFVERRLKRVFGMGVPVIKGPAVSTRFSGIRLEVFVHVSRLEDYNGVMPDGAHVTRVPVRGQSTFRGFEEDRPGRIELTVTCVAGSYSILQEINEVLSPAVLLSLELLPDIPLGTLPDESVQLHFKDFTPCLHSAITDQVSDDGVSYYRSELVFNLNGFIHVWITKRGGFGSSSSSRSRSIRNISRRTKNRKTETKAKKTGSSKRNRAGATSGKSGSSKK